MCRSYEVILSSERGYRQSTFWCEGANMQRLAVEQGCVVIYDTDKVLIAYGVGHWECVRTISWGEYTEGKGDAEC